MTVIFLSLCLGEACSCRKLWSVHYMFRVSGLQRSSLRLVCPAQRVSISDIKYHQSHMPSCQERPCGLNDAFLRRLAIKDHICCNRKHMAYELQILLLSFPHQLINLDVTGHLTSDWIGRGSVSTLGGSCVREICFVHFAADLNKKQHRDVLILCFFSFSDGNE